MDFLDNDVFEVARMLAVRIPEMVFLLLGIMLSLRYWHRYPRPALLAFLGFALLLLQVLVGETMMFFMEGHSPLLDEIWFLTAEVVRSFLAGVGYLLLSFAPYAGRKQPPPLPPLPE
jgi:hypothetical protein